MEDLERIDNVTGRILCLRERSMNRKDQNVPRALLGEKKKISRSQTSNSIDGIKSTGTFPGDLLK